MRDGDGDNVEGDGPEDRRKGVNVKARPAGMACTLLVGLC